MDQSPQAGIARSYAERRQLYLEAEIAADRPRGNGRAEVFNQIPRLELNRGPLNELLLHASIELVDARRDCADFALAGLLRLLYKYRGSPLLAPEVQAEVERAALGFCYWYDQPGVRGMCFHTENHQILFHSCELLAGQLFRGADLPNSGRSGDWHAAHGAELARQWLDQRARFGFAEWLSNCYFEEDLLALLNLYDFAEDPEIRRQAGMLVDMVLFEIALHSHKGVLGSTHGRTYAPWIKSGRAEPTASIAWLIFGHGQLYIGPGGYHIGTNLALSAFATSDYRCPPLIQAIAQDQPNEIFCRERHGLNVADAPRYGIHHDRVADNMFFWACQTARHPAVRATAQRVAQIADDPWLLDFIAGVDAPLEACRALIEEAGSHFDGDVVNTALSAVDLVTFRTPHYQLSCAQDFRPGKPGYQQHPWHAMLDRDAMVFTNHPGTDDEQSEHTARPNFWAGNRWLPRAAQHRNVLVCIHHVPQDDPRPYSHAYFPRRAFDEVLQRDGWTFGRKGGGYIALYSQHRARWAEQEPYADVELRAEARNNIWICEMGDEQRSGSFARFVETILAAPVACAGLRMRYNSPSLGALSFGWDEPLRVGGQVIQLHNYQRFDNPYCQAELGAHRYVISRGGDQLVLDFRAIEKGSTVNDHPDQDTPAYLDPAHPLDERVRDLLAHMTLAEKISQMAHGAAAIPRLGIPAYNFWNEALHGVGRNGRATVFPQAIGMAATWNPALVERIAAAIADEARAKYHETLRRNGDTLIYQGLTFWSPNVNIFRDPRWGRGQETWGEDPYLTGELGAAFVRGLQGDHPMYLKTAACAKHYAVHSGPEKERHTFDAIVSRRDMYDTYLPAFKKLVVEAKVESVMGAYNRTNGEPCCASPLLLGEILRGEWGFAGHVVSDCGALSDIHTNHKVTKDGAESAALALIQGCDIGCDCVYTAHLPEAIERGLATEADIDRALARTLTTRFKLGMFDPAEQVPYAATPMSVVGSQAHRELAHTAAANSVVLLKNKGNILPIRPDIRSLCVIGPTAASIEVLLGNYYGMSDSLTTILEGVIGRVPDGVKVEYRVGTQLTIGNGNAVDWAQQVAADSDLAIVCMGISPLLEGEEGDAMLSSEAGDRAEIGLPAAQVAYLKKLAERGARIVLVLTGGSPIALGELEDLVEAIVFVWYPGQEGGRALAEVLFGDVAPSGKLPLTFPRSLEQLPPYDDYAMAGRTYRYMTAEPLYPFGFGLSYTRFGYSELALAQDRIAAGEALPIRFSVANLGAVEAEEVAQIYLSDIESSVPAPLHKLVGFQRVRLKPGERRELAYTITPEMLALVGEDGRALLEPGQFRITVGGCSPGARGVALGAPEPLVATFAVA